MPQFIIAEVFGSATGEGVLKMLRGERIVENRDVGHWRGVVGRGLLAWWLLSWRACLGRRRRRLTPSAAQAPGKRNRPECRRSSEDGPSRSAVGLVVSWFHCAICIKPPHP